MLISDRILVLMSTYNGEKYISEQIESIIAQDSVVISLLIRDDGSTDKTPEIIKRYAKRYNNISYIQESHNLGSARSFMRLLKIAEKSKDNFDYFAFSDQDDVWLKNKLKVATKHLKSLKQSTALLYCSKPQLVDKNLQPIDTKWINLKGTFGESMLVNGALGCTEVFNKKLFELINLYDPRFLVMHDGWIYRICLATGGNIFFDNQSYILYRQHEYNVVGGKSNMYLKWKRRINAYIRKQKNVRYKTARELLIGYDEYLTAKNKKILNQILKYPNSFRNRLLLLSNNELRTNSKEHNVIFKIAVLIGIY
ncbi:MAG: glycosyltransferase family 2 protein [Bacteroidota bacterium]